MSTRVYKLCPSHVRYFRSQTYLHLVVIDDDVFRIAKIIKLNYAIQDYFFEN